MRRVSAEEKATLAIEGVPNQDGQNEKVGDVVITHRFVESAGATFPLRWHLVTSGRVDSETLVLVHGHPFSWAYWKPLITELGNRYRILAIDLKGYGQSDKRAGDWRPEHVAEELLALLDSLALTKFNLIAADRGTVVCDHLVAEHLDRVVRYIRVGAPNEIELEGDHDYEAWHREPMWASDMLQDSSRYLVGVTEPQFGRPMLDAEWYGFVAEFSFPGIGSAVSRYFQASSFRKEQVDRRERLFPRVTCPVLALRGDRSARYVTIDFASKRLSNENWREQVIPEAGVYLMIDAPAAAVAAIDQFLSSPAAHATQGNQFNSASPRYSPSPSRLPPGVELTRNHDGQVEMLGRIEVTHRFIEAKGAVGPVRWHYVEAGDPKNETIIYLHGHPESWYGGRHQIEHFADRYFVIAPDLKGYGQSDKRPGDFRHENVSEELLALFDQIGLKKFNMIAHDRGAVQADYIGGNHPDRVLSYVRMQQISHLLLPTNSPQERLFRDPVAGPRLFSEPKAIFDRQWARFKMNPIDDQHLNRMISEVGHPGFSDAVPRYFQSSSFQKELYDRTVRLFKNMHFPVLILQAGQDVGQPRWYYDDPKRPLTALLPDARIEWVEGAGHFTTINYPEKLTLATARFLDEQQRRSRIAQS